MTFTHPSIGEIRTVTKFLFFPLRLKGITKWLEVVSISQYYGYGRNQNCPEWHNDYYKGTNK